MLFRKVSRQAVGPGFFGLRFVAFRFVALRLGVLRWVAFGLVALGSGGVACSLLTAAEFNADADTEKFFEAEVRPLLVRECFACHGQKKQESGLRLDSHAGLLRGGDSGAAVVPGRADESLLLRALSYDADVRMPPRGKLPAEQIAVLRRWIEAGAVWPGATASDVRSSQAISAADRQHWSFQPLGQYAPPSVQDSTWPRNEIDRFLLARQESAGVRPVADADRRTLIRRATQDLLGLPPTAAEVARFLDDPNPDAYDRLIDRLLASPHYGERWGRHWLDLARYADTAGDGADYPIREAYKYRNYVIQSLNRDKPYDQFVREQIAGDILAAEAAEAGEISRERYAERVIATGYLAVTKRFGYNVNTEFQHLDIADTLDTLGQSLLGLSIGCARCHDHKYDPVTAADYYALYGIFASTQYSFPGGEEHKRPHHLVPLAPPAEVAVLRARQQLAMKSLDDQLEKVAEARRAELEAVRFAGGVDFGFEAQTLDKPPAFPWFTSGPNTIKTGAQSPFINVHPPGTRGVHIADSGPHDGIRQEFPAVTAAAAPRMYFNIDLRNATAVGGDAAYRLYLGHGAIASLAWECGINSTQFVVRDGGQFKRVRKLETGQWYNLQLDLDLAAKSCSGRIGRPDDMVEFTAALAPDWDGTIDTFFSDGLGPVAAGPVAAGPVAAGQGGAKQENAARPERELDNLGWQATPFARLGEPSPASSRPMADLTAFRIRLEQLDQQAATLRQQRQSTAADLDLEVAYGVSESTPVNARIQRRGEPDRLGEEVPRRFLEILGGHSLPADASGSGRLELAQWLTSAENPLTARVMVNRVWQRHFGQGLVATPSDFGTRGQPPSHPELLDWLTATWIAEGWSLKKLHRRIMVSRAYQLASVDDSRNRDLDPLNQLYWRQTRRPLDAEEIRDAVLAVGGGLDRTPGELHPFPPVDQWSFTIHYPFHAVYESNRRSVYLMIQRARRHPFLALFDAADPNISTAQRQPTITPTQALYLTNSELVHQQSDSIAQRVLAEAERSEDRVQRLYLKTLAHSPEPDQMADALSFVSEYRERLVQQLSADTPADTFDQAAWAALARVIMTSNEFLYVD